MVSGTALQGVIRLNDAMMLGPDSTGSFARIVIKSIHRKRMPVKEVRGGQTASFALKKVHTHAHNMVYYFLISSLLQPYTLVFGTQSHTYVLFVCVLCLVRGRTCICSLLVCFTANQTVGDQKRDGHGVTGA